jgi:hypothetical protein
VSLNNQQRATTSDGVVRSNLIKLEDNNSRAATPNQQPGYRRMSINQDSNTASENQVQWYETPKKAV